MRVPNVTHVPLATYRVQLNRDFGLRRATELPAYLDALGISDLYSPPILKARSGSRHGYDIVDPKALNPDLGSQDEFNSLSTALQERGMGLLLGGRLLVARGQRFARSRRCLCACTSLGMGDRHHSTAHQPA